MQEERMKILQMVAEGKISADEAETLLRSLGSKQQQTQRNRQQRREHRHGPGAPRPPKPPKPPKPPRMGQFTTEINNFTQGIERFVEGMVGDVVGGVTEAVRDNFDSFTKDFDQEFEDFDQAFDLSPTSLAVEPDTALFIKNEDGLLTLVSSDEPALKISGAPAHHYRLHQKNGRIELHNNRFGLNLTIHIPREVTQLSIQTELSAVMAMGLTHAPRDLQIKSQVGRIDLNLGTVTAGRVLLKTEASPINLVLSEQSAFDLKASKTMGDIKAHFPFDEVEQAAGYLSGSMNGGGAKIRLISAVGEIKIESLSPAGANQSPSPTSYDVDVDVDIT